VNQNEQPLPGRVMALDLGEKRIGIALSDPSRSLAKSYAVLKRSSRLADFERIRLIIDEQGVCLVIVGLPTLANGQEGSKAAWARSYAGELADHAEVPVKLWDESYSTIDAEASLRERGVSRKKRKSNIDAVAASFILQSYLNSLRGTAAW
jgi:putative Holliday junction resolvase